MSEHPSPPQDQPAQPSDSQCLAGVKVLVVTIVHDPADARIHRRQIGALISHGADVTFAAPFRAFGRTHDVRMDAINLPRALGRTRIGAIVAARKLLAERAQEFDAIILHDPELLMTIGKARHQTCVIWDVHEDTGAALLMKTWLPRWLRVPVAFLVHRAESWAERRVHLTLAETSYQDRFSQKHPVVANSVPVTPATPPEPGEDSVVYVGRITKARGALEMIELGRRLHGLITVELFGPCDSDVQSAMDHAVAAGWVVAHGFVPNSEAMDRIPGALAGISLLHDQPNYRYSRPTKIIEYMASGIPVVSTPNPSSEELVVGYNCGALVPFTGTAAAAAEVLLQWKRDRGLRTSMGKRGREAAVSHLDWNTDAQKFATQIAMWATQHPSYSTRRAH